MTKEKDLITPPQDGAEPIQLSDTEQTFPELLKAFTPPMPKILTSKQGGAEQIIAELTGNESHIALIAEASGIAPSNEDLCYQAMGLILNLFPPEEHGEDADVANLFEIVEIIKYREAETAALRERVLALEDQQINMAILLHERADLLERREQRIRELTEHIELISLR